MKRKYGVLLGALLLACSSAAPQPKAAKRPTPAPAKPQAKAPVDPEPWRSERPKAGAPAQIAYPEPEVVRLANGLTLYVLRRPAGIIELDFVVRHGASSVEVGKSGLAGLTARMLTEGTRAKSSLALAEAVESLGTTLEAEAGRDYSSVGLDTLKPDLERGLSLLAEVVKTPAFADKEFERVRREWLDGLIAERQEPAHLAGLVGLRTLLGPAQGAPVSGSVPDVKALTVQDLKDFHARLYAPDSSALVLVGDVGLEEAKPLVERFFGTWKSKAVTPPPLADVPAAQKTHVLLVDRPEAVQTALFLAQPFPKRNVAGHEAREILNNLLGGLFTSRINQNLREKHAYTYGASSSLIATRNWGAFAVTSSVKSDVTAAALDEIRGELEALHQPGTARPITPEELARAKTDLVNDLGAHLEHTSRIASDLINSFAQGLPTDYASRYAPLVESLPKDAVAREATRLHTNELVIVAVGDRKLIQPMLEKHGYKVEPADPKALE